MGLWFSYGLEHHLACKVFWQLTIHFPTRVSNSSSSSSSLAILHFPELCVARNACATLRLPVGCVLETTSFRTMSDAAYRNRHLAEVFGQEATLPTEFTRLTRPRGDVLAHRPPLTTCSNLTLMSYQGSAVLVVITRENSTSEACILPYSTVLGCSQGKVPSFAARLAPDPIAIVYIQMFELATRRNGEKHLLSRLRAADRPITPAMER
jgi:hypothetical protein